LAAVWKLNESIQRLSPTNPANCTFFDSPFPLKTNTLASFSIRDPIKQRTYKPSNGQKQPKAADVSQNPPLSAQANDMPKAAKLALRYTVRSLKGVREVPVLRFI
jgi:hypothetical protein